MPIRFDLMELVIDSDVRTFIELQRTARLATVDQQARPHIVPICFALHDNKLYTPVDEKPKTPDYTKLRRLRNITEHPRVQVLFDEYDDSDWTRLRYVQLRGHARVIDSGIEHADAIQRLRSRYEQYIEMALESRPVIAIDVDGVVDWKASHG